MRLNQIVFFYFFFCSYIVTVFGFRTIIPTTTTKINRKIEQKRNYSWLPFISFTLYIFFCLFSFRSICLLLFCWFLFANWDLTFFGVCDALHNVLLYDIFFSKVWPSHQLHNIFSPISTLFIHERLFQRFSVKQLLLFW